MGVELADFFDSHALMAENFNHADGPRGGGSRASVELAAALAEATTEDSPEEALRKQLEAAKRFIQENEAGELWASVDFDALFRLATQAVVPLVCASPLSNCICALRK